MFDIKSLSILGSTGSIGTQSLDVVRNNKEEFNVQGLTTNTNIDLLKTQIDEFNPEAVCVFNPEKAEQLKQITKTKVYEGLQGLIKIATLEDTKTVINSLVGSIGVLPTYEAIKQNKDIALANKETLVTAGQAIMEEVKDNMVTLMPIDSEHSAIFQCLNGEKKENISKITLTCSGGPFKNHTKEMLEKVTNKDALNHPTWKMGNKITIDSATLMNKGFEVIETHFLYDIPYENIEVVIHPQSIIHSLVEFNDSSTIAQMGNPDMKVPIQYALSYPKRFFINSKKLNLVELKSLSFNQPNLELFPCLKFAYEAGKQKGSLACVMNAANEIAVQAFLNNKIQFLDIPRIIKKTMDEHKNIAYPTINFITTLDQEIKERLSKQLL